MRRPRTTIAGRRGPGCMPRMVAREARRASPASTRTREGRTRESSGTRRTRSRIRRFTARVMLGRLATGPLLPQVLQLAHQLRILGIDLEAALEVPFGLGDVPLELGHLAQEQVAGEAAGQLLQDRLDLGGRGRVLLPLVAREEELDPG